MDAHLRRLIPPPLNLGDQLDGVAVGLDANGLLVDETGIFAAVLVEQVQRVAGELHAAGLGALGEVGVAGACAIILILVYV